MKSFVSGIIVSVMFLMASSLFAQQASEEAAYQPRFSDQQLFGFFDANQKISNIQKSGNEEIESLLTSKGLTQQRFQEISRGQERGILSSFSDEEVSAFNEVGAAVTQMQNQIQENIQTALAEENLTFDKYQEILGEYRKDAELQQYVRGILRDRARERARAEREAKAKENQTN